jgi:hypothetical protein
VPGAWVGDAVAREPDQERGADLGSLRGDLVLDGAVPHDAVKRRLGEHPRVAHGRCTDRCHSGFAEEHAHLAEGGPGPDDGARDLLFADVDMRLAAAEEEHGRRGGALGDDVVAGDEDGRLQRRCEQLELAVGHVLAHPALLEERLRLREVLRQGPRARR